MSARSFRSTSRSMPGVATGDFGVSSTACCAAGSLRPLATAPPASASLLPGALLGRAVLTGAVEF